MLTKSIKFILLCVGLISFVTQENYAKTMERLKEKKTYYDTLSPRRKVMLGVAAGLTISGLMYYALARNDWKLWNYLKNNPENYTNQTKTPFVDNEPLVSSIPKTEISLIEAMTQSQGTSPTEEKTTPDQVLRVRPTRTYTFLNLIKAAARQFKKFLLRKPRIKIGRF